MSMATDDYTSTTVSSQQQEVKSCRSALKFLLRVAIDKNPTDRLLAWVFSFFNHGDISKLHSDYQCLITRFYPNPTRPLEQLPREPRHTITVDLQRSLRWFCTAASELELKLPSTPTYSLHAHRILASLVIADPFYAYTQGYDRFMLVTYLLSLLFTTESHMSPDIAESVSFHLTSKLLRIVNASSLLGHRLERETVFRYYDELVETSMPELQAKIARNGFSSFHYALKWRLLFFTDEHSLQETFAIWDAIIALRDSFDEFFGDLMLAHLGQVTIGDEMSIIQQIQQWRNWDCERLLRESLGKFSDRRPVWWAAIPWGTVAAAAAVAGAAGLLYLWAGGKRGGAEPAELEFYD
jgi:hypothetical protein